MEELKAKVRTSLEHHFRIEEPAHTQAAVKSTAAAPLRPAAKPAAKPAAGKDAEQAISKLVSTELVSLEIQQIQLNLYKLVLKHAKQVSSNLL